MALFQDSDIQREDKKILKNFRLLAESYSKVFETKKNHILNLLGSKYNYFSGLFREGLIKDVLREVLPSYVSIDSGFIYGYGQIKNSKQLDIIIWDSLKHSPIYKTKDFVIVSPESVIAVVSVKSKLTSDDLKHGIENLFSLNVLDINYKYNFSSYYPDSSEFYPISKFLVFYDGSELSNDDICQKIASIYLELIGKEKICKKYLSEILKEIDFYDHKAETLKKIFNLSRVFPRQICAIESNFKSFYFGTGPLKNSENQWGPTIYPQEQQITSPFEKFIFYLLQPVYDCSGAKGISVKSAWGDIDPSKGWRSGDASEIIDNKGIPLIKSF